jgi:hypothetical protein
MVRLCFIACPLLVVAWLGLYCNVAHNPVRHVISYTITYWCFIIVWCGWRNISFSGMPPHSSNHIFSMSGRVDVFYSSCGCGLMLCFSVPTHEMYFSGWRNVITPRVDVTLHALAWFSPKFWFLLPFSKALSRFVLPSWCWGWCHIKCHGKFSTWFD